MTQKIEIRDINLSGNGELKISGTIPTNSWSQQLGSTRVFIEKIEKGAFKRAIDRMKQAGQSISFFGEHDSKLYLASTRNGSLSLNEDDKGLQVQANFVDTVDGDKYYKLIKNGLIEGLSFGMQVLKDSWTPLNDGTYQRSISDLNLFEISAVANPVYATSMVEARSLTVVTDPEIHLTEEINKMATNDKKIRELRAQLEQLEGKQPEKRSVAIIDNPEETRAKREDLERRAVNAFLRKQPLTEEQRAVVTNAQPGQLTIPTTTENLIIRKLVEQADLFSRARSFPSQQGFLKVIREQDIGGATFIGEMQNVTPEDFTFDTIELTQTRAATAIEISQQMLNDSAVDIVGYIVDVLTRRLSREMNKSVLLGDTTQGQLEGMLAAVGADRDIAPADASKLSIDDFAKLELSIHPDYNTPDTAYVVSRNTFIELATLKDAMGNFYLQKDIVNGQFKYTLFGHPVLIQSNMPDFVSGSGNRCVMFANMQWAYATMIKKGIELKRIFEDTQTALKGSQMFLLDIYIDGKVLQPDAVVFLKS